jgi:Domain of unknown function (DUF1874)
MPITLLNAPVLTTNGTFTMTEITTIQAKHLLMQHGFVSAIGHEHTAQLLGKLLDIDCPMNRVQYQQEKNQIAIVFRLNRRLNEGQILESIEQLEDVGYSFCTLVRSN